VAWLASGGLFGFMEPFFVGHEWTCEDFGGRFLFLVCSQLVGCWFGNWAGV